MKTWLHDEVAAFDSVDELARFLGVVVLGGRSSRGYRRRCRLPSRRESRKRWRLRERPFWTMSAST